ncbi:MAG: epimerase [Marinibacterium sp.]
MTDTALILGASGRFGRAAADAFARAGWVVRRFQRVSDDVSAAAAGAQVIVNAWNPPYTDWADQVPGLHAQVRRAALAADATVILPGNVYVFGPSVPSPWSGTSAHRATNPLGRIRIDLEAAYRDEGVRTIVLRAGDFLDTQASGNWFDRIMAKGLSRGRFVYPGNPDIPHAWAFLPDLAQAAVDLADRRADLPQFADVPFPGYTLTGREMADQLCNITGKPIALRTFPWWQLALARPFWPMARHLVEMRYLWDLPHGLDGATLIRLCPDLTTTPVQDAFRTATAPLFLSG